MLKAVQNMSGEIKVLHKEIAELKSSNKEATISFTTDMQQTVPMDLDMPPAPVQLPDAEAPEPLACSKVSFLSKLRELYGHDAKWRCTKQRDSVRALANLQEDVILALRTGIGKTAIAVLPSMVENGYTIIVVPLISLMDDWKRRLTEFGIPFQHFKGKETHELNGNANIILVSSDVAKNEHWRQCIGQLNEHRPVLRMIIDEAHYYFTDVGFRSHAMSNAFTLRHMPMQVCNTTDAQLSRRRELWHCASV